MLRIIRSAAVAILLTSGIVQAAPPRVIEGADPAIWSGKADRGPITHIATKAVFADKIGAFSRFRVAAVTDGSDVATNYEMKRPAGRIVATVYLFQPRSNMAEHRLAGALTSFGQLSPQAFVWADGPFAIDAPQKLQIFKGTYKTGLGPDSALDYLYFAQIGRWTVKIRATLPNPKEVVEEQAIDAFVRALPWASILTANGSCSGTACVVDRPMAIDHHIGEMFFSSIVAKEPEKLIKDITYTGNAGNAQWQLITLPDGIVALFAGAFGAVTPTAPVYGLVYKKGKETRVVRFWSRLPTKPDFDQAIRILGEKPEQNAFVPVSQAAAYAVE